MEKPNMSVVFPPSLPSRSEHSKAQVWYIGSFHTSLLAKDRYTPGCRFQDGLPCFFCQISCSNIWLDRKFQASAQTLFDVTFRL